jgi:dTDP-4-dehydrorhamnose 3,5-epimerase
MTAYGALGGAGLASVQFSIRLVGIGTEVVPGESVVRSLQAAKPAPLLAGDFVPDKPYIPKLLAQPLSVERLIDGVTVTSLAVNSDERGSLVELLTTRDEPIEPIVHVYQVIAEPGSVRAWVYHRHQHDRLAFTSGRFRIALYDLREGSPTRPELNVFEFGSSRPCRLQIPPFVAHGTKNMGGETAAFVNMPTKPYLPSDPDKCRLPASDPRIPFSFDD